MPHHRVIAAAIPAFVSTPENHGAGREGGGCGSFGSSTTMTIHSCALLNMLPNLLIDILCINSRGTWILLWWRFVSELEMHCSSRRAEQPTLSSIRRHFWHLRKISFSKFEANQFWQTTNVCGKIRKIGVNFGRFLLVVRSHFAAWCI